MQGCARPTGYDLNLATNYVIPAQGNNTIKIGLALPLKPSAYTTIAPYVGLVARSSITIVSGVADSSYRGEIKVVIFNRYAKDFVVEVGDQIT